MLSVAQCRALLGEDGLSDEDIEKMRLTLYGFADMLTERYIQEHPKVLPPPPVTHDHGAGCS